MTATSKKIELPVQMFSILNKCIINISSVVYAMEIITCCWFWCVYVNSIKVWLVTKLNWSTIWNAGVLHKHEWPAHMDEKNVHILAWNSLEQAKKMFTYRLPRWSKGFGTRVHSAFWMRGRELSFQISGDTNELP